MDRLPRDPRRGHRTQTPLFMDLFDTTQIALQRAIAGTSLRQTALASNLANADTPGYQRQDVDFHSALKSALQSQSITAVSAVRPTEQADSTSALRYDGSNIDVDKENAAMAENGVEQEALVDVSKARISILRTALGVQG